MGHVVKDILEGSAVRQIAHVHLATGLLAALALMRMQKEHQLLLDQLALLRISCRGHWCA